MFTARVTALGMPIPGVGGKDGAGDLPLYDEDETDVLRDELIEAFTMEREKMITRDERADLMREELAMKEQHVTMMKKERENTVMSELKAKQDALKRLYASVLSEVKEEEKGGEEGKKGRRRRRRRHRKSSDTQSETSFHAMYTVFHDPATDAVIEIKNPDGSDPESSHEALDLIHVIKSNWIPKEKPKKESIDRSKFVLKQDPRLSKPPPLLSGDRDRLSLEMAKRRDVRYSKDHTRYSFDVDVAGPFFTPVSKRKPRRRNVGTQVMMVDEATQNMPDIDDWGEKGSSFSSERKSGKSQSIGQSYEGGEVPQEGAGDASSSSHASETETGEEKKDSAGTDSKRGSAVSKKSGKSKSIGTGKTLERKESKRREAETMARPRGYRDLDLKEQPPYVTFEAETTVTGHDLDREIAKSRGTTVPKDNILWPTGHEFDIDMAVKRIEDYIKRCWEIDPKWLFVVQPLEVYHDSFRKKFVFEVKFSVPSPTTPVPPATASVFFVFEIPLYGSSDDQVQVTYVLEGTRFPHTPGRIQFQDKWLQNIITDKLRVQKAINF